MSDHAELYRLLPHRHPVLLVDRILAGETVESGAGSWLETSKAVSGSEPCYRGVREGAPASAYAYPATLLLESFIQSAAALWARTAQATGRPHEGVLVFGGVQNVTYLASVQPGDTVRHRVELVRMGTTTAILTGTSRLANQLDTAVLTVGSLVLALRPPLTDTSAEAAGSAVPRPVLMGER